MLDTSDGEEGLNLSSILNQEKTMIPFVWDRLKFDQKRIQDQREKLEKQEKLIEEQRAQIQKQMKEQEEANAQE